MNDFFETDDSVTDQPEKFNIIDRAMNRSLYEYLPNVEQDQTLNLLDHPEGLISVGFSTCYAVIVKKTAQPTILALSHVAYLKVDVTVEYFEDVISELGIDNFSEVTFQFARSMSGYTESYIREYFNDPGKPDPETYFKNQDEAHIQFFKTYFSESTIDEHISDLDHALLVIDKLGTIKCFNEYPANSLEIESMPNEFFYDADDELSSCDEDDSDKEADAPYLLSPDASGQNRYSFYPEKRKFCEIESVDSEHLYTKKKSLE